MARPYAALALSMAVVSSAAILISLARAQGMPALAIASMRMGIAALVVAPIAFVRCRKELRGLTTADLMRGIGAGVLLALHFAFWISSFDYTSVMSSVVFVSTNPLFVGIASVFVLRERIGLGTVLGIIVAVTGGAVVGFADLSQAGSESLRGDILALLGAVSASGYLLLGRSLRKRVSLSLYVGMAYTVAAVVLLGLVAVTRTGLAGYPAWGYAWAALLALGPQLLGHTS
jgi:drug/metabolite transporter (DMT)-like permease